MRTSPQTLKPLVAASLLCFSFIPCCGEDTQDPDTGVQVRGKEGTPCLPDNSCDPGLSCEGDRCVRPTIPRPDAGPADAEIPPDVVPTGPCDEVGQPCRSPDPCAIDTKCDEDQICRPIKRQQCDDGLPCTEDICQGMGVCLFTPIPGHCLITSNEGGTLTQKCVEVGVWEPTSPCLICDDLKDQYNWTAVDGYACDDGDPCTKLDICKAGLCAGTYYGEKCGDEYSCTEDLCDGQGGCLGHPLKAGWCQINTVCHLDGEPNSTGCSFCDAGANPSGWTALTTKCEIDGLCYPPGAVEPGGCGVCDPSSSAVDWTPVVDPCMISGKCYASGAADLTGCGKCNPSASGYTWDVLSDVCLINRTCYQPGEAAPTCGTCDPLLSSSSWTPPGGMCAVGGQCVDDLHTHPKGCLRCNAALNTDGWSAVGGTTVEAYDFEEGTLAGWISSAAVPSVGWGVSDRRSSGGSYALYYGNALEGNYLSGSEPNSGTVTLPAVTLASGAAGLSFMLYVDTEPNNSFDRLEVQVNSTVKWKKTSQTVPLLRSWQEVVIDLGTYQGQAVTIQFKFDTVDGGLNANGGVYVDDLTIYHGC